MGFFQKLFGTNKNIDARLVGIWETDINDVETVRNNGNVRMTFTKDGKLTYEILSESRIQIMNLVFHTDKGIIISNQPSHPKEEKSKYHFEGDNFLILEFEGSSGRFIKTS